ncbi:hypothetical protein LQE92_01925 [Lacrimispora sp. NSJ-141]|uniref:Uncharacterized protein n=1 Tax=Lientehia hominis TaxID=2897778 RepID=A0AAP2RIC1_9FIRM|nr:hypothetical protein [Lientehia hominis]MCD2491385.1 hypothetical protein [Lientehia hominis]
MKKTLFVVLVLLFISTVIIYMKHVPTISGENTEKISVTVYSESGIKEYYVRDSIIISELCDEITALDKTAFYDFLGRRAGGWTFRLRFFNADGIEKRSITFKKGVINYDGIIDKTFYVDDTLVDEMQKKLIEMGEEYEKKW